MNWLNNVGIDNFTKQKTNKKQNSFYNKPTAALEIDTVTLAMLVLSK